VFIFCEQGEKVNTNQTVDNNDMEKEENKYKTDYADPEPDTNKLDDLFNVAQTDDGQLVNVKTGEVLDEVKAMRKELRDLEKDLPDVDQIILDNIDRANRILDKVENSVGTGAFTASMIEAAGKLIDSVTSAANSITGISYNNEVLRQKERDLDIKEKKLTIDNMLKGKEVNITNNNLVMNREELMRMIRDGRG
jgi:hypothetical protein